MIALLGTATIWMLAQNKPWSKWGFVIGLISEPFWLYSAVMSKQWGIILMCIVYTGCYIIGIKNHFKGKND
jgi:hypothetical protein